MLYSINPLDIEKQTANVIYHDKLDIHTDASFSIKLENIPVIAISLISIPVLDTLRVMLVRILNNKSPFSADTNHLHHILLNSGMSHLRTSLFLTFINCFNCIVVFLVEPNFNSKELTLIYIALSLVWYFFFEYMNRRNTSS